ncbi:MAG: hypothetical protein AAGA27_06880, partial [Pseudomonadota bacterium]
LFEKIAKGAVKKLEEIQSDKDRFSLLNDVVYLYCPDGYRDTKFSNNFLEKILAVSATTRSFKTVLAIAEKCK